MRKIDYEKFGNKIIDEYKQGDSCTIIGARYGAHHNTISNYLKKQGIQVINRQNEQPTLRKDLFRNIDTEEKAYWLGFLYADGCITEDNRIDLTLKEADLDHIEKFKAFTGIDRPIQYREKLKAYRCSFRCMEMKKDLVKLGCVPNKTWKIDTIPNIPEALKIDFVRGYFDGDGCITFGNENKNNEFSPVINITSNEEMLNSIAAYFKEPRNLSTRKDGNIKMIRWSGKIAAKLMSQMYDHATVYLERKYTRYQIFKKNGFAARKSDFPSY